MSTIDYVKGDATSPVGSGTKIICHVCNDVGGWGRGFVVALSRRWSAPEARYREWHAQGEAGGFAFGDILGSMMNMNFGGDTDEDEEDF